MRQVWIPVVLAGLLVPALVAQQQTPPAQRATGTVKSDATAVLVDVVVRDRRGRPGHRPDAPPTSRSKKTACASRSARSRCFRSTEAAPSAERASRPPPAATAAPKLPTAPAPPPVIALVFDRLSPEARSLAHKAALGYVAKAESNALIGVFGIDLSLMIYQGYTRDPALLRKAIEEVGNRSTSQFDTSGRGRRRTPAPSAPPRR